MNREWRKGWWLNFFPSKNVFTLERDQLSCSLNLSPVDVSPNTYFPSPDPHSISLIWFEMFPPRGLSSMFSFESLGERRHVGLCNSNVNCYSSRKDLVNKDCLKSVSYWSWLGVLTLNKSALVKSNKSIRRTLVILITAYLTHSQENW